MAYRVSYKYLGQNLQSETVTKDWIKNFLKAGTGPANKTFERSWSPEEALTDSWGYNSNSNSENGSNRDRIDNRERIFVAPLERIVIKHVTETGNLMAPTFSASRSGLSILNSVNIWKNVAWEWMARNFPGGDRTIIGEASGAELYNKFDEFFSAIPEPNAAAIAAAAERRAAEAARRAAPVPAPAPAPLSNINYIGGKRSRASSKRRRISSKRAKRSTRRN
jgi:hypothetical protein